MALILGIESTCDETGAAVVRDGREVLSNVVATQFELHAKYRGVVPEIASRAHIQNILPVIHEALSRADCAIRDIDAIAIANRPGLIGSLLIGVTAAKALGWSLSKPLIGIDHVHAHLYSVVLSDRQGGEIGDCPQFPYSVVLSDRQRGEIGDCPQFPAVGMVVSGGHTALYSMRSWKDIDLLGSTIDDAVGEAYDKVAAILGLGYPGGPIIDRLAADGDPESVSFPRSMLGRDSLDFSFSGLKTAVLYHVRGVPGRVRTRDDQPKPIPDIAASFQAACVDVLVEKVRRAVRCVGARSIIIGGGVSANRGLRAALQQLDDVPVFFPPMQYCTDNAAMSAGLAHIYFESGQFDGLDLDAVTHSRFTSPP